MFMFKKSLDVPSKAEALPGRPNPIRTASNHFVNGHALKGPYPAGAETAIFGMGCFWGAERKFWELGDGVYATAVGYAGGYTPNPTYAETCTGRTGHTETVLVAYDPARTTPTELLRAFWENHDPTTANRQGNDIGTQYRSAIFPTTPEQREAAERTRDAFQGVLTAAGAGTITTEIVDAAQAGPFWYAEEEHQQYLDKNPGGYCNHGPNGCRLPTL